MRRPLLVAAFLAASLVAASAQTQFRTPNGQNNAPLSVTGCLNASGVAVPCGSDSAPLMTAPSSTAGNQNVSVQNFPNPQSVAGTVAATQSGVWRITPRVGTPVASAVTTLGTTSAVVVAASATRSYLVIQNPAMVGAVANTAGIWCRIDGAAATAAPPSFYMAPGVTWAPGSSSGFMPVADITCIASAAASPIAAWSVP